MNTLGTLRGVRRRTPKLFAASVPAAGGPLFVRFVTLGGRAVTICDAQGTRRADKSGRSAPQSGGVT